MWTDRARVLDDPSPGDWIRPRLTRWGRVDGLVPDGFEAYARVLHPVGEPADDPSTWTPVRWSDVAARTGRPLGPRTCWHQVIGADDPWARDSPAWPGDCPAEGTLVLPHLLALTGRLAPHTTTPDACLFAMWEGWGDLNGGSVLVTAYLGDGPPPGPTTVVPLPRAFTDAEWAAPRLELPDRAYLLITGPLDAVADVSLRPGRPVAWTQSPALIWPADRAWCVATEIDLDSTLVGGTRAAVDAVLADPLLEAFEVRASDELGHEAG